MKASSKKTIKKACLYLGCAAALILVSDIAFAAGGIKERAEAITEGIKPIIQLISMASYIMGVGFAVGGLLKLKAHKDNPQQVQLSQGIVLLLIAAALVALPSVIEIMSGTVVGEGGGTLEGPT